MSINYEKFLENLAKTESTNNPLAVNKGGYLGLYQMSGPALVDAGFVDQEATKKRVEQEGYKNAGDGGLGFNDFYYYVWTDKAKKLGINSAKDFLTNPEAQTVAVKDYHTKQLASMSSTFNGKKSINDYIKEGKPVKLGEETIVPTLGGILKATHLLGVQGITDLLNGKEVTNKDANNTTAAKYFNDAKDIDLVSKEEIEATDPSEAVQKAAADESSWRYLEDRLQVAPQRKNIEGKALSSQEAFETAQKDIEPSPEEYDESEFLTNEPVEETTYRVQTGDTLGDIYDRLAIPNMSRYEFYERMFANNPQAFSRTYDDKSLQAGAVLSLGSILPETDYGDFTEAVPLEYSLSEDIDYESLDPDSELFDPRLDLF